MSINKPFHRNYRPVKDGFNSGYSDWAYIIDKEYAKNPEHYVRAFLMIQKDIKVKEADILVLGITFKENCPDVRNTKVVDVISALKDLCDLMI